MKKNQDNPRYEHDCDRCLFVGTYENYDLYVCESSFTGLCCIARFGNEGGAYLSSSDYHKEILPLVEARKRYANKFEAKIFSRFGPSIKEFKLSVPADYNHDVWCDEFMKNVPKFEKAWFYGNEEHLDPACKNFDKASTRLEPGKTYTVKIFPILKTVTGEECIAFLKKQNAILVGTHGLFLAYNLSLKGENLLIEKRVASFDEEESLLKDTDGNSLAPFCEIRSNIFSQDYFDSGWSDTYCLLCFCA